VAHTPVPFRDSILKGEENQESLVEVASSPAQIRTGYIPNINLEKYRYINLLSDRVCLSTD
jgi:hypothetical protein